MKFTLNGSILSELEWSFGRFICIYLFIFGSTVWCSYAYDLQFAGLWKLITCLSISANGSGSLTAWCNVNAFATAAINAGMDEYQGICIVFCFFSTGELKTTARWIRDLVAAHPEYKQDSIISEGLAYDLLVKFTKVSQIYCCNSPCSRTEESWT